MAKAPAYTQLFSNLITSLLPTGSKITADKYCLVPSNAGITPTLLDSAVLLNEIDIHHQSDRLSLEVKAP